MKREFFRQLLAPLAHPQMERALDAYLRWYNTVRPHRPLGGATAAEKLEGQDAASERVLLEPRARHSLARGNPMEPKRRRVAGGLKLLASRLDGHKELPIFEIREAA